jgi:hypothetical protein
MTSFRPFFNQATGEWITYTAVGEDSGGQFVRFNWRSAPGGVIPEHVHPASRSSSPPWQARPASPSTATST